MQAALTILPSSSALRWTHTRPSYVLYGINEQPFTAQCLYSSRKSPSVQDASTGITFAVVSGCNTADFAAPLPTLKQTIQPTAGHLPHTNARHAVSIAEAHTLQTTRPAHSGRPRIPGQKLRNKLSSI